MLISMAPYSSHMPTVEFLVEQKKIHIGKYANLKAAALKHGIKIDRQMLEIVEGLENLSPRTLKEKILLKDKPKNFRLADQVEVLGNVCLVTSFQPKPSHQ